MSHDTALLDKIAAAISDHDLGGLAVLSGFDQGGLLCSCGEVFPPKVPEGWYPSKLMSEEEWAECDDEEREAWAEIFHVKAQGALRNVARHQAAMVLEAIGEQQNAHVQNSL